MHVNSPRKYGNAIIRLGAPSASGTDTLVHSGSWFVILVSALARWFVGFLRHQEIRRRHGVVARRVFVMTCDQSDLHVAQDRFICFAYDLVGRQGRRFREWVVFFRRVNDRHVRIVYRVASGSNYRVGAFTLF